MKTNKTKKFDFSRVQSVPVPYALPQSASLQVNERVLEWNDKKGRLEAIHFGIPYDAIDSISEKLNRSIKFVLSLLGMPQTTYNKKKKEQAHLNLRDGELIVLLAELIEYGKEVFNNEDEKFLRWLQKPNISLGGSAPETFLDTATGIDEVRACLNRIDHGIFA